MSGLNQTTRLLMLALLFGVVMSLAWPPLPFAFLLFVAWLPILIGHDMITRGKASGQGRRFWLFSYVAMLVWNLLTTWWVAKATLAGGIFAFIVNSFVMTVPLMLFYFTRKQLGSMAGYMGLILYWLSFEYIHMRWEFTWPWLTLGNGFANQVNWVQWYEYTGHLGGTFWILLVNIVLYTELQKLIFYEKVFEKRYGMEVQQSRRLSAVVAFGKPLVLVLLPVVISLVILSRTAENGPARQVVLVQSDYDSPEEKQELVPSSVQLSRLLALTDSACDSETDFAVWPETCIRDNIRMTQLKTHSSLNQLRALQSNYPSLNIITGINAYERYQTLADAPEAARVFRDEQGEITLIYEGWNSAVMIDSRPEPQHYHKYKLVPGPERFPYRKYVGLVTQFVPGVNDYLGGLSTSEGSSNFVALDSTAVAPAICYESVFGEYIGTYVKKGADLIFVITNDGWWGASPGRKQHMAYARLRAIEHRRDVARSANTGISCIIDQRGNVVQRLDPMVEGVVKGDMHINDRLTYYTRHGDYLARTSLWIAAILIAMTFVSARTNYFMYRVNQLK